MTDYSAMSDFEINVIVAAKLGVNAKCEDGCLLTSKKHAGDNVISVTTVTDYCNNPSDAWPIIVKNDIMLNPNCADSLWKAEQGFRFNPSGFYDVATCYNKNPLRAAMIVFLMMSEDK